VPHGVCARNLLIHEALDEQRPFRGQGGLAEDTSERGALILERGEAFLERADPADAIAFPARGDGHVPSRGDEPEIEQPVRVARAGARMSGLEVRVVGQRRVEGDAHRLGARVRRAAGTRVVPERDVEEMHADVVREPAVRFGRAHESVAPEPVRERRLVVGREDERGEAADALDLEHADAGVLAAATAAAAHAAQPQAAELPEGERVHPAQPSEGALLDRADFRSGRSRNDEAEPLVRILEHDVADEVLPARDRIERDERLLERERRHARATNAARRREETAAGLRFRRGRPVRDERAAERDEEDERRAARSDRHAGKLPPGGRREKGIVE